MKFKKNIIMNAKPKEGHFLCSEELLKTKCEFRKYMEKWS